MRGSDQKIERSRLESPLKPISKDAEIFAGVGSNASLGPGGQLRHQMLTAMGAGKIPVLPAGLDSDKLLKAIDEINTAGEMLYSANKIIMDAINYQDNIDPHIYLLIDFKWNINIMLERLELLSIARYFPNASESDIELFEEGLASLSARLTDFLVKECARGVGPAKVLASKPTSWWDRFWQLFRKNDRSSLDAAMALEAAATVRANALELAFTCGVTVEEVEKLMRNR